MGPTPIWAITVEAVGAKVKLKRAASFAAWAMLCKCGYTFRFDSERLAVIPLSCKQSVAAESPSPSLQTLKSTPVDFPPYIREAEETEAAAAPAADPPPPEEKNPPEGVDEVVAVLTKHAGERLATEWVQSQPLSTAEDIVHEFVCAYPRLKNPVGFLRAAFRDPKKLNIPMKPPRSSPTPRMTWSCGETYQQYVARCGPIAFDDWLSGSVSSTQQVGYA